VESSGRNNCLIPIDNRGCLIRLRSSNDSMNSSYRCSHAIYSSRVFNRAACSRKSRSVYSISIHCSILPTWLLMGIPQSFHFKKNCIIMCDNRRCHIKLYRETCCDMFLTKINDLCIVLKWRISSSP